MSPRSSEMRGAFPRPPGGTGGCPPGHWKCGGRRRDPRGVPGGVPPVIGNAGGAPAAPGNGPEITKACVLWGKGEKPPPD